MVISIGIELGINVKDVVVIFSLALYSAKSKSKVKSRSERQFYRGQNSFWQSRVTQDTEDTRSVAKDFAQKKGIHYGEPCNFKDGNLY